MEHNKDAVVLDLVRQKTTLADDHYLLEITERIQRLRSLTGEQEVRKNRRKRWAE